MFGSAFFLLILAQLDSYYGSLVCVALAVSCLGFHSSGVLLNPQDIAPDHGGQLYGEWHSSSFVCSAHGSSSSSNTLSLVVAWMLTRVAMAVELCWKIHISELGNSSAHVPLTIEATDLLHRQSRWLCHLDWRRSVCTQNAKLMLVFIRRVHSVCSRPSSHSSESFNPRTS